MDNSVFEKSIRFRDKLKRNVVRVPAATSIYTKLLDETDSIDVPQKATDMVRRFMSGENSKDDFYYTTAIEYPFAKEPYMQSRYSDGTYPVWYGSKALKTTIYETVYHTRKFISAIAGYDTEETVTRERSVYDVFCNTILLDLTNNTKHKKQLISDDYTFTQSLGKEIRNHGYSGLFYPSARHKSGSNASIFKKDVLSHPKLDRQLVYIYIVKDNIVRVYENEKLMLSI